VQDKNSHLKPLVLLSGLHHGRRVLPEDGQEVLLAATAGIQKVEEGQARELISFHLLSVFSSCLGTPTPSSSWGREETRPPATPPPAAAPPPPGMEGEKAEVEEECAESAKGRDCAGAAAAGAGAGAFIRVGARLR
jgi:hypothetical protein